MLLNKQIWEKECHKLEKLESGCKHATRTTTCVPFQSVDNRGHRSWNWFVVRCRSHKVCSDPRERSTDGSSYLPPSRSGTATSWEPEAAIHFRGDRAAWKPVQATAARFYRQTVEKASRHASLGEWKKHRCSADGRVHAVEGESGIVKCKLPCSQTINAELQTVLRGGDENTSCFCHVTRASSSTTLIKCDSGRHCGVLPPLLPPVFPHVFDPTSSLTQFSLDLFLNPIFRLRFKKWTHTFAYFCPQSSRSGAGINEQLGVDWLFLIFLTMTSNNLFQVSSIRLFRKTAFSFTGHPHYPTEKGSFLATTGGRLKPAAIVWGSSDFFSGMFYLPQRCRETRQSICSLKLQQIVAACAFCKCLC